MDKTEYRMKLDALTSLVEKQDYKGALQIVDSIDWRRVKSVRTLSMVADVYEVNKKYDRCKEILLVAHDRSMIGKMVLYRLVEISLKLGDTTDAAQYYAEFVEAAPNDNSRFILKYKIYKAQRAPVQDQIAVLEDYKDREYTERWAYELAKLYSQAGQQDRCVEACDDLVLWFSEGRYVTKAMELKMQYTPLSPSQQQKYAESQMSGSALRAHAMPPVIAPKMKESKKKPKESTAELLQKMNSAGAAITQEASSEKEKLTQDEQESIMESMPITSPEFLGKTVDLREQLARSIQEVFAGLKPPAQEEVPAATASGDTGEIDIQDLEPEGVEARQDAIQPAGAKTILTKPEPKAEPQRVFEFQEEKPQVSVTEFDLEALLRETASNFSEEITSGDFKSQPIVPVEDVLTMSEDMKDVLPVEGISEAVSKLQEQMKAREEEIIQSGKPDATKAFAPVRENTQDATREMQPVKINSTTRRIVLSENTVPMSVEEVLREETPDERRIRIMSEGRPEKFSEGQKKIFSYFSKVPGMDQQVLEAMSGTYEHVTEKTSKRGNIAVMGGYGTGKTRLSEGVVKAICKDLGLPAVKYAQIDAADLNKKDPAAVVAKMSGGFLLIQRAGLLYPDVIKKLSKAMEFRTDSLIVIIEDEKTSMRGLLRNNPEFAVKFDSTISIPVFTNDELVTFARTYARESGYKMDEMGVLALYTQIGNNQAFDEPMTIAKVKDMVDGAIQKAGKGTRRFGRKVSGKRMDEQNRIILYEKDFDI